MSICDGALRLQAHAAAIVLAVFMLVSQAIRPPAVAAQTASPAAHLQQLLDQQNCIEFAQELPNATGLTQDQQNYFNGVLAFREGRFGDDDVVKPLVSAVNAKTRALGKSNRECVGNPWTQCRKVVPLCCFRSDVPGH
jgi:hypothetical protein